ncbi:hypothetical protein PanWU01x14_178430 [Parasponia andersonii]|uniref:Uncharacterized protein n=1 Tax=Parasponia andersonii TaxID=3476 RepID=A0A2P5C736_PARAD|nr:hypothetical protein PanWU01x14_178430 [Parasponia andersonii]
MWPCLTKVGGWAPTTEFQGEPGEWPNVVDVVHLRAECGRTTQARLGMARRMHAPLGHTARSAGRRAEHGHFHFHQPLLILSRTFSSQMASLGV